MGILALFLILEESFQSFIIEYDVRCRLLVYGLYYLHDELCFICTQFVELFFFYHMASMGTNQNHPVFFFFRLNIFTLMKSTKEGI